MARLLRTSAERESDYPTRLTTLEMRPRRSRLARRIRSGRTRTASHTFLPKDRPVMGDSNPTWLPQVNEFFRAPPARSSPRPRVGFDTRVLQMDTVLKERQIQLRQER